MAFLYLNESDIKEGDRDRLLKYKPFVKPGKKSIKYIEDMLVNEFSAVKAPFSALTKGHKVMVDYNVLHLIANNKKFQFSLRETEPVVYMLPRNERTEEYYNLPHRMTSINHTEKAICVIIEPKTEYIYCDSNKLAYEIHLAIGVDKEDYENNTMALKIYLHNYECLYVNKLF